MAVVTVLSDDGKVIDHWTVRHPATFGDAERMEVAVRVADTTGLRFAGDCCACLVDRATGALVTPCEAHSGLPTSESGAD